MPSSCSVAFCKNSPATNKRGGSAVKFHKFPVHGELRSKWIQFCERNNIWNPKKNEVICSAHFRMEDYQMLPRNSKVSGATKLYPHAFPTIKGVYKLNVEQRTTTDDSDTCDSDDSGSAMICTPEVIQNTENVFACKRGLTTRERILKITFELHKMIQQNKRLREANKVLQTTLNSMRVENGELKKRIKALTTDINKITKHSIQPHELIAKMKNLLRGTLSSNQIDLILKEKTRVKWSKHEICSAFTLRYFGRRVYHYVATELNYPLPSISSLQKYARKMYRQHSTLDDIMLSVNVPPSSEITPKSSFFEEASNEENGEHRSFSTFFLNSKLDDPLFEIQNVLPYEPSITEHDLSDASSTASNTDMLLADQERCSLDYIVGHIAKKFDHKYPELMLESQAVMLSIDHSYAQPDSSAKHITATGGYRPSKEFMQTGHKMEKIFTRIHKKGYFVEAKKEVEKISTEIQSQLPNVPIEIIKAFVKHRIIVRRRLGLKIMQIKNGKGNSFKRKKSKRKIHRPIKA